MRTRLFLAITALAVLDSTTCDQSVKEFRCSRKDHHKPCNTEYTLTGLNGTDVADANGRYMILGLENYRERFDRPVLMHENEKWYMFYTPASWIVGKDFTTEGGVVASQDRMAGLCPDEAFAFNVYTDGGWTSNKNVTITATGVSGHPDGTPDFALHGNGGILTEFRGSSAAPESSCNLLADHLNNVASGEIAADSLELKTQVATVEGKAENNSDLVTAVRDTLTNLELKVNNLELEVNNLKNKLQEFQNEASTASGGVVGNGLFAGVITIPVLFSLSL